jgi:5-methyltetrahydropteroyltriglutamate--homocysteine methyltransferase
MCGIIGIGHDVDAHRHAGVTDAATPRRIARVLWNDPATGVMRQADAGYEFMADQLFRRLNARFYFLEFDSPRAGPIDALKYMPEDKTVALGLVTTKSPELEQPEMLRARIQEASAFVSLERLCLSPQCGFSGNVGNTVMTADQQFAKLRLLAETARSVWQDA